MSEAKAAATAWGRLDKAAFGIVYGAIMVLAILMVQGSHPTPPTFST